MVRAVSLARTLAPVFAVAFAVVLTAAAALAWRLSKGPIPLPALSERIERGLSELSPDLVAKVSQTELAWAGDLPELRVVDVKVARRTGEPIAVLPSLAVRPSLRALAHGWLAARRIEVSGINLSLVRDTDGRLLLGAIDGKTKLATPIDVPSFFATESAGGSAARFLKRVIVHDSRLVFEDQLAGGGVRIDDVQAELVRHGTQFEVDVDAGMVVATPSFAALHEVTTHVTIDAQVAPPVEGGGFPGLLVTVKAAGGKIVPGGDAGPALPLRSLLAEWKFEPSSRDIAVTNLRASIGSATVEGSASARNVESGWDLVTQGEVRSLAVPELRRFWPIGAAASAREWVIKNITEGTVSKCRYSIRLPAQKPTPPQPIDPIDVSFDYDGLLVHYFGELDSVRETRGTGHVSSQGFEARIASGELGSLHVDKGSVDIKFHTTPPHLSAAADLSGPTAGLLEELGRPPLDIPAKIGVAANDFGGTLAGHVDVEVPLHAGLEGKEVTWKGHADLADAKVANLVSGIGIEDGKLGVDVEGTRVDVAGDTKLTGVQGVSQPARLTLRFDPGVDGNHLDVKIDGAEVNGEGIATFASGKLRALSVGRIRFGGNDLSGDVIDRQDGGYHVSIGGESLDLGPLLRGEKGSGELAKSIKAAYDGDFHVKKVLLGNGVELLDVNGTADGTGSRVQRLDATGAFQDGGPIEISLAPRQELRRLRVRSQNAGRVLKALGVFTEADGGQLTFIARFPDGTEKKPIEGLVSVRDFRVLRAPVLARILSAGSLTGIADLLQGEGISFSRARIPFRWMDGKIDVHDATVLGAMGLTAEGSIDRATKTIDLGGRVIPAYTLNSALGKIPYVGDFLVGGKGEGVFGIEYRVAGGLDHPDVKVNALSALAPGMLRNLFVDPFKQADPSEQSGDREEAPPPAANP